MRSNTTDEVFNECNKSVIDCSPTEPTLLDKARDYRRRHTEQWESREKERENTFLESFGIHREDSFLTRYYKREDEIIIEKKIAEEKRKQKAPQLQVQVQYNIVKEDFLAEKHADLNSIRRDSIPSGSDVSDCDIFKISPVHKRKKTRISSELVITVSRGKYLLNWMKEGSKKYDTCKIKCTLYPQSKNKRRALKTRATYVNFRGTSRFQHEFKIQGFTPEELAEKHVVFEIKGKNRQRKETIGTVILGGKNARIGDSNRNYRGPMDTECDSWQQAIDNPGTFVNDKIQLQKDNEDFYSGKTNTMLTSPAITITPASPSKRSLWRRTPVKMLKTRTL